MSAGGPPPGDAHASAAPGEEELLREQRAAYEAELARITVPDMLMQATVSLLNLAAHRLAPAPQGAEAQEAGRDLEQVRDAIDGVRGLLEILERRMPGELKPLREALSQLQMAYAAEVGRAGAEPGPAGGSGEGGGGEGGGGEGGSGGGPGQGGGAGPDAGDSGPDGGGSGPGGGDSGPGGGDSGPGGQGGGPGGAGGGPGGAGGGAEPAQPDAPEREQRGPGPAESSGRLWVPGR